MREGYRSMLTLALFFVVAPGALLLFGEPPGTAQFVVTVAALAVGVLFTLLVVTVILWSRRADR